MLLADGYRRLRFLPRLGLLLLCTCMLTGCLRPLYGGPGGRQLQQDLAAVDVAPIPNRIGYYLARDLRFAFNGTGSNVPARYRLVVALKQNVQTPLIDTVSGRATSATLVFDATYKLIHSGGKTPITEGVAFTSVSYDRTSQNFANIRAQRDAEIRAAKTLADQIQVRIASVLAKQ